MIVGAAALATALIFLLSPEGLAQASRDGSALEKLSASSSLSRVIDALDDDSFEVRQRASSLLLTNTGVSDQAVYEQIAGRQLSPEQSLRVQSVLRAMFERSPRGAIGITFPTGTNSLLVVDQTREAFPAVAEGLIQSGDMILRVEDEFLTPVGAQRGVLQAKTFSRDPGEFLPVMLGRMAVVRPDSLTAYPMFRTIRVDLPLGRYDLHNQAVLSRQSGIFREAWRVRWSRMVEEHGFEVAEEIRPISEIGEDFAWNDRSIEFELRRAEYGPIVGAPLNPADLDVSTARRLAMQDRTTVMPRAAAHVNGARGQVVRMQQVRGRGVDNIERGPNGEIIVAPNRMVLNPNGQVLAVQGGVRVMNPQTFEATEEDDGAQARKIVGRLATLQDRLRTVLLASGRVDRTEDARRVALAEAEALATEIRTLRDMLGSLLNAEVESTDAGDVPEWPRVDVVPMEEKPLRIPQRKPR